jgi:NTE family protein
MTEVYGVFEGGGVRGTALVGAVAAAEEQQITYRAVAGTSAGSIVASFIAAGYETDQMRTVLTETDFKQFQDPVSPAIRVSVLRWRSAFR